VTVAAIAGVMTLAVTVASMTVSFRESVRGYFEEGGLLWADLVVSAVTTEGGWLETPLPDEVAAELQGVAGVQRVQAWRAVFGQMYRGRRIVLVGLDEGFFDPLLYGARWYVKGDPQGAAEALREGRGVNISAALADRFGLHVGASITLDSPTGPVSLPVMGIVRDYMSDQGAVVVNRRLLTQRWGERGVSRLNVYLESGAPITAVRARILDRIGDRYRVKILRPGEVIRYQAEAIDRAFRFTDAIRLLIIVVTVAGIWDLLIAAIVERRRELALWRVLGADERAVRRSIVIESATIGGLGGTLGLLLGFTTAVMWVRINYRYVLGYYLDFHFDAGATLWSLTLVMVMTALTGYVASFVALRQSIIEGIARE
jgi:putative ABC transport system permease protein